MRYLHLRSSMHCSAIIAVMALGLALPGLAAASSAGDTSTNAMINGGCSTRSECVDKLEHGDGVHGASGLQALYAAHGITAAGISSSKTVPGTVTKSGNVIVTNAEPGVQAGQVVATGAASFGRTFLPGSTKVGILFKRPTSVSFATNQLPALVHMDNGRFQWAMVESCGNIVVATPRMVVVAKPAPVTPTVAPTPAPTPAPHPTPAPVVTPTPVAATTAIPQTGAADAFGVAGLSTLLVVAGYYYRGRRNLSLALRRG